MLKFPGLAIVILTVSNSGSGLMLSVAQAQETVQSVLAAQIRTQGFACDKALGARRDAKRSKADYDVWVLKCSNAVYRVGRFPDRAAQVEQLR